jgi:hypothetical protein
MRHENLMFGILCIGGGTLRLFHGYLISRTKYWPGKWPKRPLLPKLSLRLVGDIGIITVGVVLVLIGLHH